MRTPSPSGLRRSRRGGPSSNRSSPTGGIAKMKQISKVLGVPRRLAFVAWTHVHRLRGSLRRIFPEPSRRAIAQQRAARLLHCARDLVSVHYPDYNYNSFLDENLQPERVNQLICRPEPPMEQVIEYGWNPDDASPNMYFQPEYALTVRRHPVAQSTDGLRGRVGVSHGIHVWQVCWPTNERGTNAVVGVCTKAAPLHADGYVNLLGSTADGFGWDIIQNQCYHNSKKFKPWPYPSPFLSNDPNFKVPEVFYIVLDMDDGMLAFGTDDRYLGAAFRNLKGLTLYPAVSCVWGHVRLSLQYMGTFNGPRPLTDICRRTIRMAAGPDRLYKSPLPISPKMSDFVLHKAGLEQLRKQNQLEKEERAQKS